MREGILEKEDAKAACMARMAAKARNSYYQQLYSAMSKSMQTDTTYIFNIVHVEAFRHLASGLGSLGMHLCALQRLAALPAKE